MNGQLVGYFNTVSGQVALLSPAAGALTNDITCCCTSCNCDELPLTIYARVTSICSNFCFELTRIQAGPTEYIWEADITLECTDLTSEFGDECVEFDVKMQFVCIITEGNETIWEYRFYCGEDLVSAPSLTIECEPISTCGTVASNIACDFVGVCEDGYEFCISETPC